MTRTFRSERWRLTSPRALELLEERDEIVVKLDLRWAHTHPCQAMYISRSNAHRPKARISQDSEDTEIPEDRADFRDPSDSGIRRSGMRDWVGGVDGTRTRGLRRDRPAF
jgi:hypothetical protein